MEEAYVEPHRAPIFEEAMTDIDVLLDFNYPSGARLGLFTAIQNIGGLLALFFGTNNGSS